MSVFSAFFFTAIAAWTAEGGVIFSVTPSTAAAEEGLSRAEALIEKGDWREAGHAAGEFLKAHKRSAAGWTVLGRARLLQGRPAWAQRRFKKALKYDPHHAPAYYWMGRAQEERGQPVEAANEYQAAFRADPGHVQARQAWERLKSGTTVPDQ